MSRFSIHTIYRPFQTFFRRRRMNRLWTELGLGPDTLVLDVGGGAFNWLLLPERPRLILLNLNNLVRSNIALAGIMGDGRKLPFKDQAFELVYSNSVIEHLGTWENQQAFAAECKRAGRSYYIQTPNRWFPIEPHYIAFFVHWLPRRIRRRILRHFTLWGWLTRPTQADCDAVIAEIRLLTHKELQALFPEATIWRERVFGLTKSLIAVNHQPPQKRLEYGPAEN